MELLAVNRTNDGFSRYRAIREVPTNSMFFEEGFPVAGMKKQINVRVSDDEYRAIVEVADALRMKRSEVVRLGLADALNEVSRNVGPVMTDEKHAEVMKELGMLVTLLSGLKSDNSLFGSNVNQLAKLANTGHAVQFTDKDYVDVIRMKNEMHDKLSEVMEGVRTVWRTLE